MSEQTVIPSAPRLTRLLAFLLAALTLAVFAPVCHFGFVDWDDPLHTYQNPFLEPLTSAHLAYFWGTIYQGEYIPVCYMAFALLSVFGQFPQPMPTPSGGLSVLNPHVFHTANLVLHLVNALLVLALLRRVVRHDFGAFAGALLFAVHPVQVEAVAWISELRGLLAGCLGLCALHLYLRYAQTMSDRSSGGEGRKFTLSRHYLAALILFVLALLVKPSAVALPLLAWTLDWGVARRPLRTILPAITGWFVAALPIFWLTRNAQPIPTALNLPLWQRPLIAADALAFYASKLLLPVSLGIDYGRTPAHVLHSGAAAWGGATALLLVGLLLWRRGRRHPLLLVCVGLFATALMPVLGFVPFLFQNLSTVGDRYLYLALLGPALAVALAWERVGTPTRLAFGVVVALWVGLSARQVPVWHDSRSLYENTLAINPDCGPMHFNLGGVYMAQGNKLAAIGEYQEALRFLPNDVLGHCYLGTLLGESGNTAAGIAQLRESTRLDPRFPLAHYNLGCLLFRANRRPEAAAQFHEALRLQPGNAAARQALRQLERSG